MKVVLAPSVMSGTTVPETLVTASHEMTVRYCRPATGVNVTVNPVTSVGVAPIPVIPAVFTARPTTPHALFHRDVSGSYRFGSSVSYHSSVVESVGVLVPIHTSSAVEPPPTGTHVPPIRAFKVGISSPSCGRVHPQLVGRTRIGRPDVHLVVRIGVHVLLGRRLQQLCRIGWQDERGEVLLAHPTTMIQ